MVLPCVHCLRSALTGHAAQAFYFPFSDSFREHTLLLRTRQLCEIVPRGIRQLSTNDAIDSLQLIEHCMTQVRDCPLQRRGRVLGELR